MDNEEVEGDEEGLETPPAVAVPGDQDRGEKGVDKATKEVAVAYRRRRGIKNAARA